MGGFCNWAYLNKKGKKEFGHIFRSGMVPVKSVQPEEVQLNGFHPMCYFIKISELTGDQFRKMAHHISREVNSHPGAVIAEMQTRTTIPLSTDYIIHVIETKFGDFT